MEIDPCDTDSPLPRSSCDRIHKRLARLGIAEEYLLMGYPGIVAFVQNSNWLPVPELVASLLPPDDEVWEIFGESINMSPSKAFAATFMQHLSECVTWVEWIMFMGDPKAALTKLSSMSSGRGVCGAVWGENDIAYRCRTCENDPTCAICVPCFMNGNHEHHDYSIIYTGAGCCDCGDVTAWRREGFCSKHKGAEQIVPLPDELGNSVGPALDELFCFWKNKLDSVDAYWRSGNDKGIAEPSAFMVNSANIVTHVLVEMVLEFCKYSESMLSFCSKRIVSSVEFLDVLMRAEWFLIASVVEKLQEMFLKLLGEPSFKQTFAKVFLSYYPSVVQQVIDQAIEDPMQPYPLLWRFSVQIFTVPPLTPQLVKEMDLLSVLLRCLENIFLNCIGENGCILVSKWANLNNIGMRVLEDIRFVLCHDCVPKYVNRERKDILKAWMNLLEFMQGMCPLKRQTGIHIEDVDQLMDLAFYLGHSVAIINALLIKGAFNLDKDVDYAPCRVRDHVADEENEINPKSELLSQGSTVCGSLDHSSEGHSVTSCDRILTSAEWLTSVCLKSIEKWLEPAGNLSSPNQRTEITPMKSFLNIKGTFTRFAKGRYNFSGISYRNEGQQVVSPLKADKSYRTELENKNVSMVIDKQMKGTLDRGMDNFCLLNLSYWPDIAYDVGLQDVSLHIPLHRVLALLLHNTISSFSVESSNLSSVSDGNLLSSSAILKDFFRLIIKGCHPIGFSAFIMEHPLRNRVFVSQVHAGMWRKNGDVAIISRDWYRSVRWAERGLELDLFLLQCCGAWAPPNNFVQRIGERFGLSDYLSLNSECSDEYELSLVHDMVILLIQIFQERRYSGLSPSENLRRELIHKLVIGDATRSKLVKSLPRDLSKFDQLQEILDSVATYSNPSGFNQGMYSLRWVCWKELDLYYPHWSPRDLQAAEERFMQYTSSLAATTQLPRWKNITPPLKGLARIATCKMTLQVIRAVLFYAVYLENKTPTPDALIISALHFLSLSLDVCSQQRSGCYTMSNIDENSFFEFSTEEISNTKYPLQRHECLISLLVSLMKRQKEVVGSHDVCSLIEKLLKKMAELDSRCAIKLKVLAPEMVAHLTDLIEGNSKESKILASESEKRKARARERQAAIMAKMKAEQSKFLSSIPSNNDPKHDEEDNTSDAEFLCDNSSQNICSLCHEQNSKGSISYLVLVQKSRIASFSERMPPAWNQVISTELDRCAVTKKLPDPKSVFSLNGPDVASLNINTPFTQSSVNLFACHEESGDDINIENMEQNMYFTIVKELNDTLPLHNSVDQEKLCSDNVVGLKTQMDCDMLIGKYVDAVERESSKNTSDFERMHGDDGMMSSQSISADGVFGVANCDGVYLSSCGHAVHQQCLDRYLSSLRERHVRRVAYEGGHIVNPDQGEFLCPVCRLVANSVLPGNVKKGWKPPAVSQTGKGSLEYSKTSDIDSTNLWSHGISLLKFASYMIKEEDIRSNFHLSISKAMWPDLDYICRMLRMIYFPKSQDTMMELSRVNYSMIMWDVLKYCLASTEITARCGQDHLQPICSTAALYQELKSTTGFALSMLLSNAQCLRYQNAVYVIQRFQGVLLFVDSICFGVQTYKDWQFALKCIDSGVPFDKQFWDRAAAPILAHDTFSSLMWLLFCLPYPFMSCKESFLSLVHVFYFVTIVQATIVSSSKCSRGESDDEDNLIFDVADVSENFPWLLEYFVSDYIDQSSSIWEIINKLTFPFLRRCALLWKVVNSSVSDPFSGRDSALLFGDSLNELQEAEDLKRTFRLPDLNFFMKDQNLRTIAHRWLHHFQTVYKLQFSQCVLHLTPCVPLKLMRLPYLYQDLLQRCIKQRCVLCKTIIEEPSLCLLCGKLCSTGKICCSENTLQYHAVSCGAGTGVYLLLRRTTILLQRSARQSHWPSLYLDSYGEEDIEMHRGKPLYLNEERYASLTYMVASHGVDRSSKVLNQTILGLFN